MKSRIHTIAIAAIAAIASLCPALHAQTNSAATRVNVPFSFDCGTRHLAHGTYAISLDGHVLAVKGSGGVALALAQSSYHRAAIENNKATVVFRKYGDRYFLVQILTASQDTKVIESAAERRASREFASRGEQPAMVALALLPERVIGQ